MVTDQIADLLTRLRNAQMVGHSTVVIPASKMKENILNLLVQEGYIAAFEKDKDANDKPVLRAMLKYDAEGQPVIKAVKRLSSPGKRMYVRCQDVPRVKGGLGLAVISSSKGIISDRQARLDGIGGELICSVF